MKWAPSRRAAALLVAADAAFAALVAAFLIATRETSADVFDVRVAVVLAVAGLLAAAAAGVAMIGAAGSPGSWVRALAALNVAGGAAGWVLLVAAWGRFEPDGRWLLAFAADLFIALGVLQWLAVRAERELPGDSS
ncbi:MAG: hypothetical protein IT303_17225 [Dehalococcoidia bacterium]|nr:hypothetical protein [Dehalococcoidia bacterium]